MSVIKDNRIYRKYQTNKIFDLIPQSFIEKLDIFIKKTSSLQKKRYILQHFKNIIYKDHKLTKHYYLIANSQELTLNSNGDPTEKERLELKVNLTNRYIIRNKFIKIILKYLPIIEDPKQIIYSFIGVENFHILFNTNSLYDYVSINEYDL